MSRLPTLALALTALAACDAPLRGRAPAALRSLRRCSPRQGPRRLLRRPRFQPPRPPAFAVLGACGLLHATGIMPQTDGFITVQVGEAGTATVAGSEDDLATLLRLPQGAALLTEAGNPATVTLGQIDRGDGLVSVRFADSAPPPVEGLMQEEWRAFLDLDDRLVTIGVRGYARAPL